MPRYTPNSMMFPGTQCESRTASSRHDIPRNVAHVGLHVVPRPPRNPTVSCWSLQSETFIYDPHKCEHVQFRFSSLGSPRRGRHGPRLQVYSNESENAGRTAVRTFRQYAMSVSESTKRVRGKTNWLANLALLAATVLILFALCEMGIRIFDAVRKSGDATATSWAVYHEHLGYRPRPGVDGVNADGLRGDPIETPKRRFRILMLGDSVAFYGDDAGDTFPGHVQRVLRADARLVPNEVLNAGVRGYTNRPGGHVPQALWRPPRAGPRGRRVRAERPPPDSPPVQG